MSHVRPHLPIRSRAPQSSWLLVLALVIAVLLAPALVAGSVTSSEQSVSFRSSPWLGWPFLGAVVTQSSSSPVASPGAALRAARDEFASDSIEPTAARLAYAPAGQTVQVLGSNDAAATFEPDEPLVWMIDGRMQPPPQRTSPTQRVVAVMGYRTGRLLYDVRTALPHVERDVSARAATKPTMQLSPEPATTKEGRP